MISGIAMKNTIGQYFNVTVISEINPPNTTNVTKVITTNISTDELNKIEWVCINIIVFNARVYATGEFYFKRSSNLSYQINNVTNYGSLYPQV